MSCKKDINKAILDKAFSELTEGRYTFNRIAEDTIQITNTGKAKSKEQAQAIAQSLIDRASKSFKGNIRGEISQHSVYDPVTIRFRVNPKYIEYEYSKLDPKEQTDTTSNFQSPSTYYKKVPIKESIDFIEKELGIKYGKKAILDDIEPKVMLDFAIKYGNSIQQEIANMFAKKLNKEDKIHNYIFGDRKIHNLRGQEDYNFNDDNGKVIAGWYSKDTSNIAINLAYYARQPISEIKRGMSATINHEIIHHFTLNSLLDVTGKFYTDVDNLYKIAKDFNKDNNYHYGLTNIKEFVTEALTNEKFQIYLSNITYKKETETIWTKLLAIINKAFKDAFYGTTITNTVLKEVTNIVTNNIFQRQSKVVRHYNENNTITDDDIPFSIVDTGQQQNFSAAEEQDMINGNTGPNSHEQLNGNGIEDSISVGYLVKYLQLQKSQLKSAKEKLNKINTHINSTQTNTENRVKLNVERRKLKEEIEGIHTSNVDKEGLEDRILRIEANSTTFAVGHYIVKDLDRIDRLVDSNSIADLEDAKALVDFYERAGIFRSDVANPFFLTDEIFQTDNSGKSTGEFLLSKEIRDKFKDWADQATSYKEQLENKIKEVTVAQVNSDPSVKKTYNKELGFSEITSEVSGLEDTDWFSMWTMDMTQGIFSKNGILPQVMFSTLQSSIADDLRGAREVAEQIDELNPKVIKRLKELNQELGKLGILKSNGVTFQLFKEKTKDGHENGNFITKFTPEFNDEEGKAKNKFWSDYNTAKVAPLDTDTKNTLFKDAFNKLRDWRRKNTVVMDLAAIPEIIEDEEFKEFTGQLNTLKAEGHKKELIELIGEKEYNKQVEGQKKLLREYALDRQNYVDTLVDNENVLEAKDLSNSAWDSLDYWDKRNSPFYGVGDFTKVIYNNHIDNFGKYNTFIPRRNIASLSKDESGYNYTFKDSGSSTGYYNNIFEKYVENDEVLGEFHNRLLESNQFIRECLPYDKQLKFAANSLPAMLKNSAEIVSDGTNTTNILRNLFDSIRHIWEQIRLNFGVIEQSQSSYEEENPITGEVDRKVNDNFIANNTRAISERMTIEAARFLQAYNTGLEGVSLDKITRYTNLQLSKMNADSALILAEYLGVPLSVSDARTGKLDSIKRVTGDSVEVGRIIRDFATHTVVQAYSFDLAKLIKHGTYAAAMYSARTKALPVLSVMKNHYENIKNPKLNNVSKQLFSIPYKKDVTKGERDKAKKQIEDWFERVVLDDYGLRHTGIIGSKKEGAFFGRKIYSNEEKEKYKQLTDLIAKESNDKTKTDLLNIRNNLGKTRTTTAAFNNLLAWIRTMRLGFNLSSGVTNYVEGWMSNMIIAATGEYFDPNMIYKGYGTTYSSFWKNISYGKWEPGTSKKQRILMDKFKVVMNTANQLQESTEKTFSDKLEWIHPHAINERVEYNNQGALFNAMLRSSRDQDHFILDKDGNRSNLWDAYNDNGNLKEEFRTEDNIKNWENLQGDDYKTFEQRLSKALVLAHGNYDEMRGMMAKSTILGKAGLMFKTWLPQQLYWRFAIEQDDLQSGTKGFKGKYRSYGTGTAALHGIAVGAFTFGPIGAAVGAIAGGALGKLYGVDSGVNLLKETLVSTLVLVKKMIGMPINTLVARKIVDTSGKEFDKWISEGKFTRQDSNALKSNMADIANQLMLLGLMLMVKSLFWDDNDSKDDPERKAHNLLVNRIMQLASQAGMYVNPSDIYKSTIGSNGVIQYMTDLGKEIDAVDEALQGRDVIQSGVNEGKSHLWSQTKKTLVPGIFKSIESGGFGTQMQSQQQQSPFDYYFKSEEAKERLEVKRERASKRLDLEDQFTKEEYPDEDERKKVIKKELDEEIPSLPTHKRLQKLGMTMEEWKQYNNIK